MLKQKYVLTLDENLLKKIVNLEEEMIGEHKLPDLTISPNNALVLSEKEFEATCIVLETKGHEKPHLLSCKKFFQALEFWEKQLKPNKNGGSDSQY